jgi:hypothetical protein
MKALGLARPSADVEFVQEKDAAQRLKDAIDAGEVTDLDHGPACIPQVPLCLTRILLISLVYFVLRFGGASFSLTSNLLPPFTTALTRNIQITLTVSLGSFTIALALRSRALLTLVLIPFFLLLHRKSRRLSRGSVRQPALGLTQLQATRRRCKRNPNSTTKSGLMSQSSQCSHLTLARSILYRSFTYMRFVGLCAVSRGVCSSHEEQSSRCTRTRATNPGPLLLQECNADWAVASTDTLLTFTALCAVS